MSTRLMASAIGAIFMAGSTFTFADDWEGRQVVTSSSYVHHDGGHDSDHAQCSYRGHVHYHVHSHVRPYVAHHYHHHGYGRPYHRPHSGLTIIYRGSFH